MGHHELVSIELIRKICLYLIVLRMMFGNSFQIVAFALDMLTLKSKLLQQRLCFNVLSLLANYRRPVLLMLSGTFTSYPYLFI